MAGQVTFGCRAVDDPTAHRSLSLRGNTLVRDDVRPRRYRHGASTLVAGPVAGPRRALVSWRAPIARHESVLRCRSRKDIASDTQRRDGCAGRGAVWPLFR